MHLTNIFNPSLFYLSGQQESCHPDFHFFAIRTSTFLLSGLQNSCYPIQFIILSCLSFPSKSSLLLDDKV